MTKKALNSMKRTATKQLILGALMALIGTIPVALHWGTNHTGSLFLWILASMAICDSIKKLIKYNRIG